MAKPYRNVEAPISKPLWLLSENEVSGMTPKEATGLWRDLLKGSGGSFYQPFGTDAMDILSGIDKDAVTQELDKLIMDEILNGTKGGSLGVTAKVNDSGGVDMTLPASGNKPPRTVTVPITLPTAPQTPPLGVPGAPQPQTVLNTPSSTAPTVTVSSPGPYVYSNSGTPLKQSSITVAKIDAVENMVVDQKDMIQALEAKVETLERDLQSALEDIRFLMSQVSIMQWEKNREDKEPLDLDSGDEAFRDLIESMGDDE